MDKLGLYVYGIVSTNEVGKIEEILGIDEVYFLETLKVENFYAVMSRVNLGEYGEGDIDKRLEDMVWVEEKARRHFEIVQQLAKLGTTIPMKFCTIFQGTETFQQFIDKYMKHIIAAFSYFQDKEEWTLKIYCDRKKFLECNMNEERQELKEQMGTMSKGAAYFLEKKLASSLDEKAREKIIKIKEKFWNHIENQTEKVKINKNLSKQVTGREQDMILNAALLIQKKKVNDFIIEIKNQEKELCQFNMNTELVGAWPLYDFAEIFFD